jgi:hypothetical protein
MAEITSRLAIDEADCGTILKLLVQMHAEVGRFPMSPAKVCHAIENVVKNGVAYIVERDGDPVATIGLVPASPWYADAEYMTDRWCFVRPDARADSRALDALLDECQDLANATETRVEILVFNPKKRRSGREARIGKFSFEPGGSLRRITPRVSA